MGIVAGYARVSTENQAYQVALSNQVERLLASGCDRVYSDIGSRSDDTREGIQKLIESVKAKEISEVRIIRLDRITSSPGLFEQLTNILRTYNVALSGLDEIIDVHSVDGEFSAGLQVYFGKREVRTIQLRSQRGHDSKRKNARPNASVPFGYTVENRQYKLDRTPFLCCDGREFTIADLAIATLDILDEEGSLTKAVEAINERFGLQRYGKPKHREPQPHSFVIESPEDFAKIKRGRQTRKGIFYWSHDSLAWWFRSPVLRGHTPYNTRILKGTDEAGRRKYGGRKPIDQWDIEYNTHPDQVLLSETRYQELEKMIAHNARTWAFDMIKNSNRRYPLSGLLRCSVCRGTCKSYASKVQKGVRYNYYRCKNSAVKSCDQVASVRSDRLEAAVIEALCDKAEAINAYANSEKPVPVDSPEIQELQAKLVALVALGDDPAIAIAKDDLRSRIQSLQWQQQEARSLSESKQRSLSESLGLFNFWDELETEEKTRLFRWLIRTVWLKDGAIDWVEFDF